MALGFQISAPCGAKSISALCIPLWRAGCSAASLRVLDRRPTVKCCEPSEFVRGSRTKSSLEILRVSNPATRKDLADRIWGGSGTQPK